MSTISIGVTGLNAASIGLATTSHNIANASTPGYNRQLVVQATNFATMSGAGYIGQGTHVSTVMRVYSQYVSQQVLSAQTNAAEMDSYYQQISQIDNILGDISSGLSSAISGFFNGLQSVAADPSSIAARQSMLSTAQTLVARFQSLDQNLSGIRDGVNSQIASEVSLISGYADQIAAVNERILQAQSGSLGQPPNDLLDQRDQLIADLNKEVRVSTLTQSDGTMNVFFGNGQPLVVGTSAYSLTSGPSFLDPQQIVVKLKAPTGTLVEISESQITGGTLGGLVSFRNDSLDSAQNALGRIAVALTQTFNAQHMLGQDLSGTLGGEFFQVSDPAWVSNSQNTGTSNLTASFTATAANDLTTSDYRLTYSAANTYTLTRLSDGTSWSASGASPSSALTALFDPLSATSAKEGFSVALSSGAPAVGDSFKIEPTRTGASSISVAITDARNIAAAAPIRTAATTNNTGTGSISSGSVNGPAPLAAALTNTVTITFTSANTFDVVDSVSGTLATGVAYTAGSDITYNGWTVQISGAPTAGDAFTVGENVNGVSDSRNAVALGALQTSGTMIGGGASYLEAYSQLVSEIGNKTREVKVIGESQQALADSAIATQQGMSGVNLDEEAANLLRYQQAYQASAKVIEISSKIFDSILALG